MGIEGIKLEYLKEVTHLLVGHKKDLEYLDPLLFDEYVKSVSNGRYGDALQVTTDRLKLKDIIGALSTIIGYHST